MAPVCPTRLKIFQGGNLNLLQNQAIDQNFMEIKLGFPEKWTFRARSAGPESPKTTVGGLSA